MARVPSFLLLFPTCILLGASIKDLVARDVVLDIDGDPLTAGGRYYTVSAFRGGGGGGLTMGRHQGTLTVKQEKLDSYKGTPLFFLPFPTKEGLITESKSLTITFVLVGAHNDWQLTLSNDGKEYVTIDRHTLATYSGTTLFQIKPILGMRAYKIVGNCIESKGCSDLGIKSEERWLEISEMPLLIVFIKADNVVEGINVLK